MTVAQPQPPPTSWETQLDLALREAAAVDPDAVLWMVTASPIKYDVPDGPVEIAFKFVRPSGEVLCIHFEDIRVEETIRIDRQCGQNANSPSAAERAQVKAALAHAKIGPAEAIRQTLAEGRAFVKQHGDKEIAIAGLKFLDATETQHYGTSIAWSVIWFVPSSGGDVAELNLWVHAETGVLINRRES
jgi:hypothetical protein